MKEGFEGGKSFSVSVNSSTYLGNFTITASRSETSFTPIINKPKSVKKHEILHAIVAEKVKPGSVNEMTREPGKTYSGATFTSVMSIEAAAAAYAFDEDGTEHDEGVVHYLGGNLTAAASNARVIVYNALEEADELEKVFDEKATLSGEEVRTAIHRGSERRQNPEVTIVIFNHVTREKRKVERLKSNKGTVMMPGAWMVPSINEGKIEQKVQEAGNVEAEVNILPLRKKRRVNVDYRKQNQDEEQKAA